VKPCDLSSQRGQGAGRHGYFPLTATINKKEVDMKSLTKLVFAAIMFLSAAMAQEVPVGGTIPNPFPFPVNFQLAIPDPSNPLDPWKEVATGVAPVGGGIPIPEDPSLCGLELRVVAWVWGPPIQVWGPFYFKITC